jgi:hypothetical protein
MLSAYIPVRVVRRNFVGQLQPGVKRMETFPKNGLNQNHHDHHTSMFLSIDLIQIITYLPTESLVS